MRIQEVLVEKFRVVCSIAGSRTVEEAIEAMSRKGVSAMIVMEEDHPVGIFAERDVFRCYVREKGKPFSEIEIRSAMTQKLIVAEPGMEIGPVVTTMLTADIRHLPVVEDKRIIGMLTIGELVGRRIGTLTRELGELHDYIADLQDARLD